MKLETILRIAAAPEVTPVDLVPALGAVTGVQDLPALRRRVEAPVWERRDRHCTA